MTHLRFLLAAALAVAACTTPEPVVLATLGTACTAAAECGSGRCYQGVCTRQCFVQGDCPLGFDCGILGPDDSAAFCVKAAWTDAEAGGFGTDCSASAAGCGGASTCADGFSCHAFDAMFGEEIRCNARAFCTKGCAGDRECPPDFFCGQDTPQSAKSCLRRAACDACATDDQCPASHVCALLADRTHGCLKRCETNNDCLKPVKDGESGAFVGERFEACAEEPDGKGKVCMPTAGRCKGTSVIASITGEGQVCSPCRVGHPEDCSEGHFCIVSSGSGERFCSKPCQLGLSRTSSGFGINSDSCPDGSFCFLTEDPSSCGSTCTRRGVCTADPTYATNLTCYPKPAP
jgi:hypothetical protein